MQKYESTFIFDALLNDEELQQCVEKYKQIISRNQGEIFFESAWERRKLSYPINTKNYGYYYLFYIQGNGQTIDELNRLSGFDENVLRLFHLKVDDLEKEYKRFVEIKQHPFQTLEILNKVTEGDLT